MEIFISWSGARSRVFANEFKVWIQCVLQATRPWISTEDIPGGSIWFSQISEQLANTTTGIICLTRENFRNEWILFESGALFKGLPSSRLHTILIDLQPSDVVNSPLTQLNHAEANEAGIRKLVRDLNRQMGPSKIEDNTLNKVLDMYWPKFEELLKQSMEIETDKTTENANDVSERQMLEEILSAVRNKPSGRSMIQEAIARDRLRHIDNRVEINPDMLNAIDRNTYLLERRLSEGGFITPDDLTSMNAEAVAHLAMLDHLSPKLTDPKYAMICIELKKRLFGIQLRIEGM